MYRVAKIKEPVHVVEQLLVKITGKHIMTRKDFTHTNTMELKGNYTSLVHVCTVCVTMCKHAHYTLEFLTCTYLKISAEM